MLHSPRALIKTRTRRLLAGHQSSPEQDSEVNDFKYALRTRRRGATAHLTEIAADSVIGPNRPFVRRRRWRDQINAVAGLQRFPGNGEEFISWYSHNEIIVLVYYINII